MEKDQIIKFLQSGRRGVYPIIVEVYFEQINGIAVSLAVEVVKEDLQSYSEDPIAINYWSLRDALKNFDSSKIRKKPISMPSVISTEKTKKFVFKDTIDSTANDQKRAGEFNVPE